MSLECMTEENEYNRYRIGKEISEIKVEDGPQGDISSYVPRPLYYRIIKRLFDIVASLLGLILLSPLFMVVSILIFAGDGYHPFYLQERTGKDGKHFKMLKFRSMKKGADKEQEEMRKNNELDGPAFKMQDDPRVTKIGKFLRKTSIDELPQLINCIIGNMSLVGPRPLPVHEQDECNAYQAQRLLVKPGITCIWQCSGRSDISFDEWVEMDLDYIKQSSVWLDIKLLFKTILAVIKTDGAY